MTKEEFKQLQVGEIILYKHPVISYQFARIINCWSIPECCYIQYVYTLGRWMNNTKFIWNNKNILKATTMNILFNIGRDLDIPPELNFRCY